MHLQGNGRIIVGGIVTDKSGSHYWQAVNFGTRSM